jgi:hypothetical protein
VRAVNQISSTYYSRTADGRNSAGSSSRGRARSYIINLPGFGGALAHLRETVLDGEVAGGSNDGVAAIMNCHLNVISEPGDAGCERPSIRLGSSAGQEKQRLPGEGAFHRPSAFHRDDSDKVSFYQWSPPDLAF